MKGVVIDFLFPKGHKELNRHLISDFIQISDVTVVDNEEYLGEYLNDFDSITVKKIRPLRIRKNAILSRLIALKNMININKVINWDEYDFIWVNTFETMTFAIGRKLLRNKKVFLMHHKNTDELVNKVKRVCFNTYKNKVYHIVFEEFIKEYLINEIGVEANRVFVIPHPINYQHEEDECVDDRLCVALSNSNDEFMISQIIESEKRTNIFSRNNIKLVLKSSGEHEESEILKIIKGYISKNEYDDYMKRCKYVLIPFSSSYNNRTSGVILDALANGKIVIGRNIPIVRSYANMYPNICYYFNNASEIPEIMLKSASNSQKSIIEFKKFKSEHADSAIIEKLMKIIEL